MVKLNATVFEVFENIKTVKYLRGEDYEVSRYEQDLEEHKKVSMYYLKRMAYIWGVTAFFSYSSVYALGFWYGTKLVIS